MSETASWREEYPFESNWMALDGHQYHFIDEGSGDDTILCVHGNPTWSFYWRHVVKRFRERMRVIAVDHIGCGLSDKPQRYEYCLDTHATNLGRLIESRALRNVTLLAHDWGGAIGLLAAVRNVDCFKRIILLNTGAFPPPFVPWRIAACRIPLIGSLAVRGLNMFAGSAIKMAMSRGELSPTAKAGLLAPYRNWHDRIAIDRFVADIPTSRSHRTWSVLESLESDLQKLNHLPAMFVWGMRDWCFRPECMQRLLESMPHAQSVTIDDAGHYVMEDATAEVLGAIDQFTCAGDPSNHVVQA